MGFAESWNNTRSTLIYWELLQQLERGALLRCRPEVDRRPIDLAGEVEQNADLVLQRCNQFRLGENHGFWGLMRSDAVTAMFGQFAITRFSADTSAVVLLPSRVYTSCSIG